MNTQDKILKYLKEKGSASGTELSNLLGISRQAINRHIKKLIESEWVIKEGTTKGALYKITSPGKKRKLLKRFRKTYLLQGLEEHKVFKEVDLLLNLRKNLKNNVYDIIHYAFTEILNNAIEHSQSERCFVETTLDQYRCSFEIRDYGIGIFYSIFTKFALPDENAAIGELIKGKTTTMQERHTGEGVFFTSKAGDVISFRSHKICLVFDNVRKDLYVEEKKLIKGTKVSFSISRYSKTILEEIFEQYAPEEFEYKFEKTRVYVKLFQSKYVSRSEARRLLSGLDKFKEVILDFKGVKSIAQSFADEIFRVFKEEHPDIIIKIQNLRPSLEPIIKHVVDNKI